MTSHTKHIIKQLHDRINRTRKRLYLQGLAGSVVHAYAIILLVGVVLSLVESLAGFSAEVRTALFYSFCILSGSIAVVFAGKSLLRYVGLFHQHTDEEIARIIGAKFEEIKDRLENALDLSESLRQEIYTSSPELIEVSLEHFLRTTAHLDFGQAVSFASVKKSLRTVGAITATVFALLLIPNNPFSSAAERLWFYYREYRAPAPFIIQVEPGNSEALKGESITVRAKLVPSQEIATVGALPKEVELIFADEGVAAEERITVQADSSGKFVYTFSSLKNSLRYSFRCEEIASEKYFVKVVDRPFVRSMAVILIPPAYSKLPKQRLDENVGDIIALPGSRVQWGIIPSKEIKNASVVFRHGWEKKLTKHGDRYWAQYKISAPTTYYIELEDSSGYTNAVIEYKIDVLTDEYPSVEILSPGKNLDVTQSMMLPMAFKISDDFGISQLQLAFRLVQSRFLQSEKSYGIILPFDSVNFKDEIVNYDWDLSLLGLVPEDVVEYYAEVKDNDVMNGPKSAKSATFLIRLPSLEEVFAGADRGHDDALKTMEEAMKDAEELKKEIDELSREMKRSQQMDWQKEKKAEEIAKRYEEIQKKVEEAGKKVDEMMQNMERHNVLSPETIQKYAELQKLMQEINAPEFQEALKRMQQAMQNVSPEQLRQAMEQAQFSEEQFRASIERTMNLIKRIQIEQKVDEVVKRAQEMLRQQAELVTQTQQLKDNDAQQAHELAHKQEEINQQLDELQKALKEVREKMEEFPKEMPMEKLEDAEQAADDKQMKAAMQQSVEHLRSMRMEHALMSQQQASSGIKEMSEQISELQEQLLNNQLQQTMSELRKAMQDLLQVSQQQEQLKNQSRQLDPSSQQFRDIARQQQNLQGDLSNIADALSELSKKSFVVSPQMGAHIGKAMAEMRRAMVAIEQRNAGLTSALQAEAMASLNIAAMLVQGAMQSLQQQGGQGGGSLMQQLRSMAMQQQQINMQTQQLGQQEGMSQEQLQEMGRLARQQEAVRKSLEQLQKEAEGNVERERILGDLNKIAEEMKEVVEKLQQNDANPNTLRQQERILSRLLQAQRSMRERDFEQKRRATTGITPPRRSPAVLSQQSSNAQLRRDLQRAMESGYSKDYIELIRKYYEAISKEN